MNDEAAKPETSALKDFIHHGHFTAPDVRIELAALFRSLLTIQTVLDYATDSSQMRYNIAVWTKDAIDALLRGEVVVEPSRKAL